MKSRLPAAILLIAAALAGALILHDALVLTRRQIVTRTTVYAIEQYRAHVSPHLRGRIVCRFVPTCSAYGLEAVKKYGGVRGGWKTATRIARCNPMTPMGSVDLP